MRALFHTETTQSSDLFAVEHSIEPRLAGLTGLEPVLSLSRVPVCAPLVTPSTGPAPARVPHGAVLPPRSSRLPRIFPARPVPRMAASKAPESRAYRGCAPLIPPANSPVKPFVTLFLPISPLPPAPPHIPSITPTQLFPPLFRLTQSFTARQGPPVVPFPNPEKSLRRPTFTPCHRVSFMAHRFPNGSRASAP